MRAAIAMIVDVDADGALAESVDGGENHGAGEAESKFG
jgi:hypothetical protein